MTVSLLLLASLLPASASPVQTGAGRVPPALPPCVLGVDTKVATTIAALPLDVAAELIRFFAPAGGIAETGGAYNATDIVDDRLPMRRFVRAYHAGDDWILWYERGGMAAGRRTLLIRRNNGTAGQPAAYQATPGSILAGDLCTASKALLAGVRSGNP